MDSSINNGAAVAHKPPRRRRGSTARLLCGYTLLFAVFFAAVYSPFWVYGRSFLWNTDGMGQHLPTLLYSRYWAKTVWNGLLQGRLEIPFWSLWVGYGQSTIGNVIGYRPFNYLYALFPRNALELYLVIRIAVGLYMAGLSFLAFARTRVKDHEGLLLGSMLYLFSGFLPFFITMQWTYLGLALALPLMLLGVDRIFDRGWSWLFVFAVFKEGVAGYYPLFMLTLPAVIYAFFHFFELSADGRAQRGGFFRILIAHIPPYLAGLGLAAVSLVPALITASGSSRVSAQAGVNPLHWTPEVYLQYLRGIVDVQAIADNGRIALPSAGLIGILYLIFSRKKRDRVLLWQIALYNLAFLVPALTMLFSAFAGKSLRWCYAFSFWAALTAACMLPRLRRDDGSGYRFCRRAFYVYACVYLAVSAWTGEAVSISLVLAFIGFAAFHAAVLSDWGRRRRALAFALLFAVLLTEATVKSYERFSPQYGNNIPSFVNAGTALERASDNAADALDLVRDDGVFRTDVIAGSRTDKTYLLNYGTREQVNGLSSYFSITDGRIVSYSMDLANAQQRMQFKISDFDQRTALDELAGVKYAAALEDGASRVPYGYELVKSRKKKLSDGSTTTEYLYENRYALPLAYAYEACISREDYDALPPNRREQAMLQGVVLEGDAALPRAELAFDDQILLDDEAILAALREAAQGDDNLEVSGRTLRIRKANYSVSLPIEKAEGEIYLQFCGVQYQSVNFNAEKAEKLAQDGATRLSIINAQRASRQWTPTESASITATSGKLSGFGSLLDVSHQYYFGKKDLLLNLGYGETGKKLKITFSEAGEYRFDSVALIRQPMDGYADKVAPLLEHQADSVGISGNRVTVVSDLRNSAFSCLAIPYADGWSASIDGERAEILPANGMYMGVMLPEGRHTVVYTYRQRGFTAGALISLGTLILLAVVAILRKARRRRRKARTD